MGMLKGIAPVTGSNFGAALSISLTGLTAGRGLVIGIFFQGNGSSISSITVTGESNMTLIGTPVYQSGATATGQVQLAYLSSMSSGGNKTVTVNWSNTQTIAGACAEYYFGSDGGIALDGTPANDANTTADPSLSIVTGSANSGAIGYCEASGPPAAGTGFSSDSQTTIAWGEDLISNLDVGAAGTISVPWTVSATPWTAAAAGFKAALTSPGSGADSITMPASDVVEPVYVTLSIQESG